MNLNIHSVIRPFDVWQKFSEIANAQKEYIAPGERHKNTSEESEGINISSLWIWKGVSATLQSGRYTLSYPMGRYVTRIHELRWDHVDSDPRVRGLSCFKWIAVHTTKQQWIIHLYGSYSWCGTANVYSTFAYTTNSIEILRVLISQKTFLKWQRWYTQKTTK